ncbi:hypothetical protein [Mucilaginibacter sp. 21P]|nr:hypothetical protein [Mucilaginibacter sp. 21P]
MKTEIKELIEGRFPDCEGNMMIIIRRDGMDDTGFRGWKQK